MAEAILRRAPVVFAGAGNRPVRAETVFLARDRLPVGEPIPGPAVVLQTDSTTVVPPGCTLTAAAGGNLLIAL